MIKQLFRQLKGELFGKEPELPDEGHPLIDLEYLIKQGEITQEQYEDLINLRSNSRVSLHEDSTEKDE